MKIGDYFKSKTDNTIIQLIEIKKGKKQIGDGIYNYDCIIKIIFDNLTNQEKNNWMDTLNQYNEDINEVTFQLERIKTNYIYLPYYNTLLYKVLNG